MTDRITAFDPKRTTNSQAIADLAALGIIHESMDTIDLTYGVKGGFWHKWRPTRLSSNDLNPALLTDYDYDFRELPTDWADRWDLVVFDPDYGLRGTSRLDSDVNYGVDEYLSVQDRHNKMRLGLEEAFRVVKPRGLVITKCQTQTASGVKHNQPYMMWDWARDWAGHNDFEPPRLVAELFVKALRSQPERKRKDGKPVTQKTVGANVSSMQVWKKGQASRPMPAPLTAQLRLSDDPLFSELSL